MTIENMRLHGGPLEVRAAGGGAEGVSVAGYAAIFDSVATIAGEFEEVVAPGAFRAALARGDDAVLLVNHAGLPLARVSSGTLRLEEDAQGLRMETELDPSDPDVARILPKIRRGDLSKMSFAFRARRQSWDHAGPMPRRTLEEVDLLDVSIVVRPANPDTSIAMRSLEAARAETVPGEDAALSRFRMAARLRLAGL